MMQVWNVVFYTICRLLKCIYFLLRTKFILRGKIAFLFSTVIKEACPALMMMMHPCTTVTEISGGEVSMYLGQICLCNRTCCTLTSYQ